MFRQTLTFTIYSTVKPLEPRYDYDLFISGLASNYRRWTNRVSELTEPPRPRRWPRQPRVLEDARIRFSWDKIVSLSHEIAVIIQNIAPQRIKNIFQQSYVFLGLKTTSMTFHDTSVLRVFTVPKQKAKKNTASIVEESEKILKLMKITITIIK